METKKYSSYAQIENDLEILKLEKEINYQKLLSNIQFTKESLTPNKVVTGFLTGYQNIFSSNFGTIIKISLPYLINYLFNKKRGN